MGFVHNLIDTKSFLDSAGADPKTNTIPQGFAINSRQVRYKTVGIEDYGVIEQAAQITIVQVQNPCLRGRSHFDVKIVLVGVALLMNRFAGEVVKMFKLLAVRKGEVDRDAYKNHGSVITRDRQNPSLPCRIVPRQRGSEPNVGNGF